jgi:putative solute:sodium symporter small subunit
MFTYNAQRKDEKERLAGYWRTNTRLIRLLLAIWFLAAYAHPPFAHQLNRIRILTGFPLGYYLSSQGALIVFVGLIFFYALYMNHVVDKKFGFDDADEEDAL